MKKFLRRKWRTLQRLPKRAKIAKIKLQRELSHLHGNELRKWKKKLQDRDRQNVKVGSTFPQKISQCHIFKLFKISFDFSLSLIVSGELSLPRRSLAAHLSCHPPSQIPARVHCLISSNHSRHAIVIMVFRTRTCILATWPRMHSLALLWWPREIGCDRSFAKVFPPLLPCPNLFFVVKMLCNSPLRSIWTYGTKVEVAQEYTEMCQCSISHFVARDYSCVPSWCGSLMR